MGRTVGRDGLLPLDVVLEDVIISTVVDIMQQKLPKVPTYVVPRSALGGTIPQSSRPYP
jgi:hypothetical protein